MLAWDKDCEPVYWDKIGATITDVAYTEWGIRVYLVDKDTPPKIVDNALVMSLGYFGEQYEE
jgi:hypothetical protein